jgi:hypothetical protein
MSRCSECGVKRISLLRKETMSQKRPIHFCFSGGKQRKSKIERQNEEEKSLVEHVV